MVSYTRVVQSILVPLILNKRVKHAFSFRLLAGCHFFMNISTIFFWYQVCVWFLMHNVPIHKISWDVYLTNHVLLWFETSLHQDLQINPSVEVLARFWLPNRNCHGSHIENWIRTSQPNWGACQHSACLLYLCTRWIFCRSLLVHNIIYRAQFSYIKHAQMKPIIEKSNLIFMSACTKCMSK